MEGVCEADGLIRMHWLSGLLTTGPREGKTLLKEIKEACSRNSTLIWGTFIHTGLILCALILAYNSYKGIGSHLYDKHFLPHDIRTEIKGTFPWSIIIFAALFILSSIGRDKKGGYPSFRQYVVIFVLQAITINLIFLSKKLHILIVQDLALLYLAGFLFIWSGIKRFIVIGTAGWAEEILQPIIYRPLQRNMPRVREYFKEKPSAAFIIGFMALLMICAFLLIFKVEKAAEQIANIAYFSLVIGVGIEAYQMIKHGNVDNEKED